MGEWDHGARAPATILRAIRLERSIANFHTGGFCNNASAMFGSDEALVQDGVNFVRPAALRRAALNAHGGHDLGPMPSNTRARRPRLLIQDPPHRPELGAPAHERVIDRFELRERLGRAIE